MNYKKIFKSQKVRVAILRALSFIPDEMMVKLQYRIKMNRRLNLKNPQRFTEKLQWYKLYYRDPLMVQCVDKYDVRQYVESLGLGSILNECYGVFDRAEDVDFDALPQKCVLKDTLGGGGNSVILVEDKNRIDRKQLGEEMRRWTERDIKHKSSGREWPYHAGKKHRIIIEELIDSNKDEGGLIDYKFFCFNGRCEFLYVIADRELGNGAGLAIYDREFVKYSCRRMDERVLKREINKPELFDEMLQVAERLAQSFPHARIDLYCLEKGIRFGEITFFDGSGYMTYEPDSFDMEMGRKWILPNINT